VKAVHRFCVVTLLAGVYLGSVVPSAEAKGSTKGSLPPVVRSYMKALGMGTPAGAATAERLTAPGSYAAVYTHSVGGLLQAGADSGQSFPSETPTFSDKKGTVTLCSETPPTCIVFSSFAVKSHKIVDFKRDGNGFAGALSAGDGSTHDALGSSLTVLGAYLPNPSNLVVDVAVKNGDRQLAFNYIGNYIGPDGHQVTSSSQLTPSTELRPGSSATLAFVFPGVSVGGSVIVKCFDRAASPSPPSNYMAETQMAVPVYQRQ
jgi:hypothetical protein